MAKQTITLTITLADNDGESAADLLKALWEDGSVKLADLLGCLDNGRAEISVTDEGGETASESTNSGQAMAALLG